MSVRVMTVREIRKHLEELYGIDVSQDLISTIIDAVLRAVAEWQGRPLDACNPLVSFDAIRVKLRDKGFVRNEAGYIALSILPDGNKDSRHLDRADQACEVLAARHEQAQDPQCRRHPDRRRRRLKGPPRGDQRGVPGDDLQTCIVLE